MPKDQSSQDPPPENKLSQASAAFQIDADGWLVSAERVLSPNQNARPENSPIDLLVIHNISLPPGQFGGSEVIELFCNTLDCAKDHRLQDLAGVQVSAHLFIDRQGKVFQFVSFLQRAWHAGRSEFDGRTECNDYSIGIELEGTDTLPFTDNQYQILSAVTKSIQQAYPAINNDRITGHSDIAPGRKTDPGEAFDWVRYKCSLTG